MGGFIQAKSLGVLLALDIRDLSSLADVCRSPHGDAEAKGSGGFIQANPWDADDTRRPGAEIPGGVCRSEFARVGPMPRLG